MFDKTNPEYQKEIAKLIDKFRQDIETELINDIINKFREEHNYEMIRWMSVYEKTLETK